MNIQSQVPKGIGPHEGKELELLLSGSKPLAMFSDIVPASFDWGENTFAPYVENGSLIKREMVLEKENIQFRFVYFSQKNEEWRIKQLHKINADVFYGICKPTQEDDIKTGQLLGYTEEEINVFIDWSRQLKQKQKQKRV
jgi:hypothetical protein